MPKPSPATTDQTSQGTRYLGCFVHWLLPTNPAVKATMAISTSRAGCKPRNHSFMAHLTGIRQNSISLACARARQSYFAAESITASTARCIGSASVGHAAITRARLAPPPYVESMLATSCDMQVTCAAVETHETLLLQCGAFPV